jgi:NADPH-dependent glutamate synthase beta subunit-like oxidoreductase/ferredoxin
VVEIDHAARLVPACAYPARPGLVVRTDTPAVLAARRAAVELLMGEHVGDCEGPCRRGCPAGLDIPRMLRQIAAGLTDEALVTVRRDIALPAVLGRICPAPCEKVCRRARLDRPVSICLLKRFAADQGAEAAAGPAPAESGRRVAIVGAGPAGLAAAYYLRLLGHACAVYDDQAAPGGELRRGVPEDRLPRDVLDREVEAIRRLGVVFHTGVKIGRDLALADLRAAHDAVILAVGTADAAQASALGVPASPRGVQADEHTLATPVPGVFACGGALRPLQMAVRACASGKAAARACDEFLKKGQPGAAPKRFNCVVGKVTDGELQGLLGQASAAGRLEPAAGFEGGFSAAEAVAEAARCLHCDCRKAEACRLRDAVECLGADARRYSGGDRQAVEVEREAGVVVFEPGKCIKCGLCVRLSRRHPEAPGLDFVRRGFQMRVSPPFGETVATALAGLASEAIAACPTGALAWDGVEYGQWSSRVKEKDGAES